METKYPNFSKGQKVKTIFGEIKIVLFQRGCQVFFSDGQCAHPAKIWAI